MNQAINTGRAPSPFSKSTIFAVIFVGFVAFLMMLYFLGAGETGREDQNGAAHAASNGLNGYSGLVSLLEGEGFEVERSRGVEGLQTSDLLIVTPPFLTDPEEFSELLESRQYVGPTLVILPKWLTQRPPRDTPDEVAEQFREGWITLVNASARSWTSELSPPYAFTHKIERLEDGEASSWNGLGASGVLPTQTITYAETNATHGQLATDAAGHTLAFWAEGEPGSEYNDTAHWTLFVVEPDLMNNYGLADEQRAAAAVALVREAGYGEIQYVTFDLTLNGLGGSMNLLTLAFQPPFLAATICLILAMIITGWRAFLRFGPAAASAQEIAFGKARLITNGAGLIMRARRLKLLAQPYTAIVERRIARELGLVRPDHDAIDAALAARLPGEEPFSPRAQRLEHAEKPIEILRAAQALNDLTRKLAK